MTKDELIGILTTAGYEVHYCTERFITDWDDSYELVPIGTLRKKGDQYFYSSSGWENYNKDPCIMLKRGAHVPHRRKKGEGILIPVKEGE